MTNAQKTLFDSPETANRESADASAPPVMAPVGVPANDTDTSRAAARRISPLASALTARVFHFIASRADDGATDFEVQDGLGLSGDTERPRRWTLQKCGLVRDSGLRRKSPSGRAAIVYVATVDGLQQSKSQAG